MTLSKLDAQELVDGLSAITLGVSLALVAWQGRTPLRTRLAFAFGGLCLFFTLRAAAETLYAHGLELAEFLTVSLLPLAALMLVEGVLRRHAPRVLKIVTMVGAIAVATALIVTDGWLWSWYLGGYVVVVLTGSTALLILRRRNSLSAQENASVDALMIVGAVLTALSVTDFLATAAVGWSGVGAAVVAFVLGASPNSRREVSSVLADVLIMVLAAAAMAFELSRVLLLDAPERIRLVAVILSLLLAVAAALRLFQWRSGNPTRGFAKALAGADTSSLENFLTSLSGEPLLAGLRLAQGPMLEEYDQRALCAVMGARGVWTKAALATPALPARARDELADLMTRTDATHAVMVSRTPLRIVLLILPGTGSVAESETSLALFRKLATIAASAEP